MHSVAHIGRVCAPECMISVPRSCADHWLAAPVRVVIPRGLQGDIIADFLQNGKEVDLYTEPEPEVYEFDATCLENGTTIFQVTSQPDSLLLDILVSYHPELWLRAMNVSCCRSTGKPLPRYGSHRAINTLNSPKTTRRSCIDSKSRATAACHDQCLKQRCMP